MICKHVIKLWVTISYSFTDYTNLNNCKVLQSEQNLLPISIFACNIFSTFHFNVFNSRQGSRTRYP